MTVEGRRGEVRAGAPRWHALLAAALWIAGAAGICQSAVAAPSDGACSSRTAADEAVRAIPWQQLTRAQQASVRHVVRDASIYRRLPIRVIDCDPDIFTFLLRHPEVVVDTWRLMGISRCSLQRLAEGSYRGTDGAGTVGQVRVLYANWGPKAQNLAVICADGAYEGGPLLAPVKAESIVLLRSASIEEENGRHYVTVELDSFIRIDRLDVELVAKTLQPWIARAADQNFIETLTFVSNFSRTAEKNPRGMERLAARLPSIDEPTRRELVELCFRTADHYADACLARGAGQTLLARRDAVPAARQ